MLEEEKATGHPTGRKGNRSRSYYRKERQQVILQEGRQQVILHERKPTGHTTGRKGNRSHYRK